MKLLYGIVLFLLMAVLAFAALLTALLSEGCNYVCDKISDELTRLDDEDARRKPQRTRKTPKA
jgi:hypothetical protein